MMLISVPLPLPKLTRYLGSVLILLTLFHLFTRQADYGELRRDDGGSSVHLRRALVQDTLMSHTQDKHQLSGASGLNDSKSSGQLTNDPDKVLRTYDMGEFWQKAGNMLGPNELYPEAFNVSTVLHEMATAKTIGVTSTDAGTSFKWILLLEGGQRAIFKPQLVNPNTEKKQYCNTGHEQPRYEVAAFHLLRLFGMRTVPFVAGRKVNIISEILPVASPDVKNSTRVYKNGTVCVVQKCFYCTEESAACFPDAVVDGSLMFWLHQPLRFRFNTTNPYHPFHPLRNSDSVFSLRLNERSHCDYVRSQPPYSDPRAFLDLVDISILNHVLYNEDEKHMYVINQRTNQSLTIHVDHGLAFCPRINTGRALLAVLVQCCRVRQSTITALRRRLPTLRRDFEQATSTDRLYPLLTTAQLNTVIRRIEDVMDTVGQCEKVVDPSDIFDLTN